MKFLLIKPNKYNVDDNKRTDFFNENIYEIFNYDYINLPPPHSTTELNDLSNCLESFLSNKKYIDIVEYDVVDNNHLIKITDFLNYKKDDTYFLTDKICLDNSNEVIMFYHNNYVEPDQFNNLTTILTPNIDTIFGPVFFLKISKIPNLHYEDMTIKDLVKLWISQKQVKCLYYNCNKNEIENKYIYNNNSFLKFFNFNFNNNLYGITYIDNLYFYKLKSINNSIHNKNDINKYLINNDYSIFEEIIICKVKLDAYNIEDMIEEEYNTIINQHIKTLIKAFIEYEKEKQIIELLFVDIN